MFLKGATKSNLGRRLSEFQSLRQPRADRVVETSTAMGKMMSSEKADTMSSKDADNLKDRWKWIWE